jgi:hypothetical protein
VRYRQHRYQWHCHGLRGTDSTDINDSATIQAKLWNALAEFQPKHVIHCSKLWHDYWTYYNVPRWRFDRATFTGRQVFLPQGVTELVN